MVFCTHCGEEVSDAAYFCLKCGVMTSAGVEAGVSYPWKWGKEVEKALSTAADEVGKAVNTVRKSIRKTVKREPIVCAHCRETNRFDAKFCHKCGKELA